MFGIRRKSRSELVRAELNESFDHFMKAATHASGGVGAAVGPRYSAARDYVTPPAAKVKDAASNGWGTTVATLAPLAAAATDGAKKAGKATSNAKGKAVRKMKKEPPKSRRWPTMVGVAALAAVVGAGAMMARRRRQQQQWDEYDPGRALDPVASDTTTTAGSMGGMSTPGATATSTTGAATSGSATEKAGNKAKDAAAKAEEKADDLLSDISTRNSRN